MVIACSDWTQGDALRYHVESSRGRGGERYLSRLSAARAVSDGDAKRQGALLVCEVLRRVHNTRSERTHNAVSTLEYAQGPHTTDVTCTSGAHDSGAPDGWIT